MAVLYAVAAWLLLQIVAFAVGFGLVPEWLFRFVFALLIICFPLLLVFSWIFEITPEGLKREHQVERQRSITKQTGRKINSITLYLLTFCVLLTVLSRLLNGG